MTLARQWRGQRPFEETWFIEALLSPDRGLWLRFVLDATRGHAEVWALLVERDGVRTAHKITVPLEPGGGPLFSAGTARLDRDRTTGSAGDLSWDLRLEDRGARHRHVPFWSRALGIGRTYVPGILDLRIAGTVRHQDAVFEVKSGPGVLGHIWGRRSSLRRWAWAHCNAFDREDLLFEGLSAQIGGLSPLTSLVLLADGHAYRFSGTRDLIRTWSRFGGDQWVFEARRGSRVLTGEIRLAPERAARVAYPRDAADDLVCTNTRFGDIRLVLRDPSRRVDVDIRSRECAFEIVEPGGLPTHL